MEIHTHNENISRRRHRTLTATALWLIITAAGVSGNGLAGTTEISPEKVHLYMAADTAPPTLYETATFAMG